MWGGLIVVKERGSDSLFVMLHGEIMMSLARDRPQTMDDRSGLQGNDLLFSLLGTEVRCGTIAHQR